METAGPVNLHLQATMPPPTSNDVQRPRAQSGAQLSSRLRAASKMHFDGMITGDEKAAMKNLILSQDPKFKDEFERAERTGNWAGIRDAVHSPAFEHLFRKMSVDVMHDFADVQLGDLGDDLAGMFDASLFEPSAGDHGVGPPVSGGMSYSNARGPIMMQPLGPPMHAPMHAPMHVPMGAPYPHVPFNNHEPHHNMANMSPSNYTQQMQPQHQPDVKRNGVRARKREVSTSAPTQDRIKIQSKLQGIMNKANASAAAAASASSSKSKNTTAGRQQQTAPTQAPTAPPSPLAKQKVRKNERERKRRLAVSQGFDELFAMLKIPENQKLDKAAILRTTIDRMNELASMVQLLENENQRLKVHKEQAK